MPDVLSGISTDGPDVNTPDGFVQALAEKAGGTVTDEQLKALRDSDRTVSSGLTSDTDPGRQTPVAEASETEEEVPEEGETSEEGLTPEILAYIEKHGGTPEQALAALYDEFQNAQTLIGRQSGEVGDLRKQVEQITAYLQEQPEEYETFDTPLPTSTANEELVTFFEEQDNPRDAMTWIVNNRPDLIEQAIPVWGEYDARAATAFARNYGAALAAQVAPVAQEVKVPSNEDPFLARMKAEYQLGQTVESARVASKLEGEAWESVKAQMIPALNDESTSVLIKNAVASSDPREQLEGVKSLIQVAQARALAEATSQATEAARSQSAAAAVERKQAARVTTGSLRPAEESQPEDEEAASAERVKRFKEQLLAAPSTDVMSGITRDK